jgi:hypothetical protein
MANPTNTERDRITALVTEFKSLEAAGAARIGHADHARRDQVLDELQDAVGLGGKMVMERDILRRAEQILGMK